MPRTSSLHGPRAPRALGDPAERLVYADRLSERGDPLGELIVLDERDRDGTLDEALYGRLLTLSARFGFPRLPSETAEAVDPEPDPLRHLRGPSRVPEHFARAHGLEGAQLQARDYERWLGLWARALLSAAMR